MTEFKTTSLFFNVSLKSYNLKTELDLFVWKINKKRPGRIFKSKKINIF